MSSSEYKSIGEKSASIKATFSFPSDVSPEIKQTFDATNCKPSLLGLPAGVEPVKPKGGDCEYSGMHDHGALPKPKEGGDFAVMISLVNEAQKNSDELLTRIITEQKKTERLLKDEKSKKKQKIGA